MGWWKWDEDRDRGLRAQTPGSLDSSLALVARDDTERLEVVMNHAQEILQSMAERFAATANVKQVFGEPIERGGRTIVPVARVKYRLGAGWGGGEQEGATVDRPLAAGGGGGGGVVKAKAAGALEITDSGVRFIRFFDAGDIAKACVGGVLAILVVRRLTRRRC